MFSETGRIRLRRARFQTPSSVSFLGLTEFRGENSVSSFQPIVCVPKRTHRIFAELTELAAELSEFSLPKQYSRIRPFPMFQRRMHVGAGWMRECTLQGNAFSISALRHEYQQMRILDENGAFCVLHPSIFCSRKQGTCS